MVVCLASVLNGPNRCPARFTELIALIGLPGSGKSTVGRHLSRRLQLPFSDSDHVVEAQIGRSIREYFERDGEESFRDLEEAVIDQLTQEHKGVLATGGGAVLRSANRQRLRVRTQVVYLTSSPDELFRRLQQDVNRPLLQVADPLNRLRELHAVRDPLYRQTANFVIETGRHSSATLVNMIMLQLVLAGGVPSS